MAHNSSLGRAAGLTDEQIAALDADYRNASCFDERQKAVIEWAEHVTLNTARYHPEVLDKLRPFFSEPEIVELTVAVAHRNMITRIQDALGTDLEGPDFPENSRVRLEPGTLERYAKEVLATTWPR